jgi:hypothetical protein
MVFVYDIPEFLASLILSLSEGLAFLLSVSFSLQNRKLIFC